MGILGGLCETFSLGVRSLVVHLSTRACSVVINSRLGKEAVVECKEMLPSLLSAFGAVSGSENRDWLREAREENGCWYETNLVLGGTTVGTVLQTRLARPFMARVSSGVPRRAQTCPMSANLIGSIPFTSHETG